VQEALRRLVREPPGEGSPPGAMDSKIARVAHDVRFAANHQAVATFETPDAAARAAVNVVEAVFLECRRSHDVVVVVEFHHR